MKQNRALFLFRLFLTFVMLALTLIGLMTLFRALRPVMAMGKAVSAPEAAPLVVILDPGHGGRDGGAVSVTGKAEKGLNLSVALRVRDILEAAGAEVYLTRTEDVMPSAGIAGMSAKMNDLAFRAEFAKQYPEAVFVSIHMNKFSDGSCRGAQIWYAPGEESHALAEALRESLLTVRPDNRRTCREADSSIWLLGHLSVPAVLVECGFLSHPEEAVLLEEEAYQTRLALALARGILQSRLKETQNEV